MVLNQVFENQHAYITSFHSLLQKYLSKLITKSIILTLMLITDGSKIFKPFMITLNLVGLLPNQ